MKQENLEYGKFYHIYNKGVGSLNIFRTNDNYLHFLNLYDAYINPVANTFAWCLMPNHFHFLVRIKDEDEIGYLNPDNKTAKDADKKWQTFFPDKNYEEHKITDLKKPVPYRLFGHLFDAYAKAYNKSCKRNGNLFEKSFNRKLVDNERYMKELVRYINNNPVKHGFVEHTIEYPWTSYLSVLSDKVTKLEREQVLLWFDDKENFKYCHKSTDDYTGIDDFIID